MMAYRLYSAPKYRIYHPPSEVANGIERKFVRIHIVQWIVSKDASGYIVSAVRQNSGNG